MSSHDALMKLADKVVIANATGNEDLFMDAVQNLIAGVRQDAQLRTAANEGVEAVAILVRPHPPGAGVIPRSKTPSGATTITPNENALSLPPGTYALYTHPPEVARDAGRWLPIESAPQDGTEFQCWFDKYGWEPRCRINDDGMVEVFGRVDYDMDGWETCPHMRATHWMPNPGDPQAAISGAAGDG